MKSKLLFPSTNPDLKYIRIFQNLKPCKIKLIAVFILRLLTVWLQFCLEFCLKNIICSAGVFCGGAENLPLVCSALLGSVRQAAAWAESSWEGPDSAWFERRNSGSEEPGRLACLGRGLNYPPFRLFRPYRVLSNQGALQQGDAKTKEPALIKVHLLIFTNHVFNIKSSIIHRALH